MNKVKIYLIGALIMLLFFSGIPSDPDPDYADLSERVKIALRAVGNELLLNNGDSISLVSPVRELEKNKFELSFKRTFNFEQSLTFEPEYLVSLVETNFKKLDIPKHYRVEVVRCQDEEVAYSYAMSSRRETTIVSCQGRELPADCYVLTVRFVKSKTSRSGIGLWWLAIPLLGMAFFFALWYKRKSKVPSTKTSSVYAHLGSFKFYAEQNKLVRESMEISLSKKECELLEIFAARPNEVIKRDELVKKVWEDNGVVVGRSLDTYISKLRKKLKSDPSVSIVNVHGVGYRLELS